MLTLKNYDERFMKISFDGCMELYRNLGAKKLEDNTLYWLAQYTSMLERIPVYDGCTMTEYLDRYYYPEIATECVEEGISRGIMAFKYTKFHMLVSPVFSSNRDEAQALELLKEMVYQDLYEPACLVYALVLINGTIVPQDLEEAHELMEACARAGNELAQEKLKCFKKGLFSKKWKFVE